MVNELFINGHDAWTTYRVSMGNGFIDSLEADADSKDYITNSVRTEHGDRVIPIRPKKASRTITLEFVIIGSSHDDYVKRVKAFDELMDNGFVTIQVPKSRDDIYRLFCSRKSSSYGHSTSGKVGKKSLKFIEANPNNRGELTSSDKKLFQMSEYEDYLG